MNKKLVIIGLSLGLPLCLIMTIRPMDKALKDFSASLQTLKFTLSTSAEKKKIEKKAKERGPKPKKPAGKKPVKPIPPPPKPKTMTDEQFAKIQDNYKKNLENYGKEETKKLVKEWQDYEIALKNWEAEGASVEKEEEKPSGEKGRSALLEAIWRGKKLKKTGEEEKGKEKKDEPEKKELSAKEKMKKELEEKMKKGDPKAGEKKPGEKKPGIKGKATPRVTPRDWIEEASILLTQVKNPSSKVTLEKKHQEALELMIKTLKDAFPTDVTKNASKKIIEYDKKIQDLYAEFQNIKKAVKR